MWSTNFQFCHSERSEEAQSLAAMRQQRPFASLRVTVRAATLALFLTACDMQDMYQQPKYEPLQAARSLEPDTVARGQLRTNAMFFTGKSGTNLVNATPLPVTKDLLKRGRERYDIFCSTCHDRVGNGNGMIVQRGFRQPQSLHIARLRDAPVGYFYDVMTTGFGAMSDMAAQITPEDRWAIVAYIRALQLSQHATVANVPAEERRRLEP